MIKEVKVPGIMLPKLYVVTTDDEAAMLQKAGLPYIYSRQPIKNILAFIFRPWFESRFKTARFWKAFNLPEPAEMIVHIPYAKGQANYFSNGGDEFDNTICLEDFINIKGAEVDIDALMNVGLIPMFLADVETAIKTNLTGFHFQDGYNKKTGLLTGSYSSGYERPNLLIVDISGSMRAVSGTLITLTNTMRSKLNADLIVTGGQSYFWHIGEVIPDEQAMRSMISHDNESKMFNAILKNNLEGMEYGNVVCFGDGDHPDDVPEINIVVGKLYAYHTSYKQLPGYCRWLKNQDHVDDEDIVIDYNWMRWT